MPPTARSASSRTGAKAAATEVLTPHLVGAPAQPPATPLMGSTPARPRCRRCCGACQAVLLAHRPGHGALQRARRVHRRDPGRGDTFYAAALAAGATSREVAAIQTQYHGHYYGGFVNDPHGINLEARATAPADPPRRIPPEPTRQHQPHGRCAPGRRWRHWPMCLSRRSGAAAPAGGRCHENTAVRHIAVLCARLGTDAQPRPAGTRKSRTRRAGVASGPADLLRRLRRRGRNLRDRRTARGGHRCRSAAPDRTGPRGRSSPRCGLPAGHPGRLRVRQSTGERPDRGMDSRGAPAGLAAVPRSMGDGACDLRRVERDRAPGPAGGRHLGTGRCRKHVDVTAFRPGGSLSRDTSTRDGVHRITARVPSSGVIREDLRLEEDPRPRWPCERDRHETSARQELSPDSTHRPRRWRVRRNVRRPPRRSSDRTPSSGRPVSGPTRWSPGSGSRSITAEGRSPTDTCRHPGTAEYGSPKTRPRCRTCRRRRPARSAHRAPSTPSGRPAGWRTTSPRTLQRPPPAQHGGGLTARTAPGSAPRPARPWGGGRTSRGGSAPCRAAGRSPRS